MLESRFFDARDEIVRRVGSILVAGLLVAAFFAGLPEHADEPTPPFVVPDRAASSPQPDDRWRRGYASDGRTRLVHAPSLLELTDGRIRAFWFAGSREGASDVAIHSSVFDPETGQWGDEKRVLTRMEVARGLNRHVRKLGNMVAVRRGERIDLYVVTVSFGGWSGSRLAVAESRDEGKSWQVKEGLVTSPFLNVSTLVKNRPVRYRDGSIGLPVYHELAGKFGEYLRLDPQNRVLHEAHMGHGRRSLQPMVFVRDRYRARALLRNGSEQQPGVLFSSRTRDGGRNWTATTDSGLPNPGSAVSGVSLGPEHWLLATNNNAHERDELTLLETRDAGQSWAPLEVLHDQSRFRQGLAPRAFTARLRESLLPRSNGLSADGIIAGVRANKCREGQCTFQFDYPYMLRADNGDIHVVYTWNQTLIGHAWWRAPDAQERP
jgi:predicted neuraminidase